MKKLYILSSLYLLSILIFGCKKDDPDPFFDSFPKKFIFESIENVSPMRLFTNQKEIFDNVTINSFIGSHNSIEYLNGTVLINSFKDDVFNFVSNSVIKYSGFYKWHYDTLFYNKKGNSLLIKTEKVYSPGNAFKCNSPICHITSWGKDSITYCGGLCYPEYSVYVENKEYSVNGNELHIPILCYRYTFRSMSVTGFLNDVFNEKVVYELTTDTLAIISYNLIFVEQ